MSTSWATFAARVSPQPLVLGSGTGAQLDSTLGDGWSMDPKEGVLMHACLTGAWRFMFLPKDHGYVCPGCRMDMPAHFELMARVTLESSRK